MPADTAVFDVDGTLVDTNYHHVIAWHRSFIRHGLSLPLWSVHRAIGMGGDKLVAHVAGDVVEHQCGNSIRDVWEQEFDSIIDDVRPFEGVDALLDEVRRRGFKVVLASSGLRRHVEYFLDLIDGRSRADGWVSSDDVDRSKPHPDLVKAGLEKVSGRSGVLIGDSIWDCAAGQRAGVPTVGLRSGGFSPEELRDAGAVDVFDTLIELREQLDSSPLAASRSD